MKFGKVTKRVIAFVLALLLFFSTIVVGNDGFGITTAKAESRGYTVNINLYGYDGYSSGLVTPESPLKSKNNNGPFYVVAVAKGGHPQQGDIWTTYAVKKVDQLSEKTTTVSFNKGDFRIDVYDGDEFSHNDYNKKEWGWTSWNEGHYDTANTYHMESVTLYRVEDGIYDYQVKTDNISLEDMLAQFNRNDAAPEGYKFLNSTVNNDEGNIDLRKAFEADYELRLSFEGDNYQISADQKYVALVEVNHKSGYKSYFVSDFITKADENLIKIPVADDEWLDSNGNKLNNEKFTGSESGRTVTLLKVKEGKNP